jgi:hypothetical protein
MENDDGTTFLFILHFFEKIRDEGKLIVVSIV